MGRQIIIFLIFNLCQNVYSEELKGSINLKDLNVEFFKGLYFVSNVKINGEVISGRFLIDTGSPTSIKKEALGANQKVNRKIRNITDGYESAEAYRTKFDIDIQNTAFKSVNVYVVENIDFGVGMFCDVVGIIGHNMMKKAIWMFDGASIQIVESVDTKQIKNEGFIEEKLIMQGWKNSVPYTIISCGTPRGTALIDTGDNGLIQINNLTENYIEKKSIRICKGRAVQMLLSEQGATNKSEYRVIQAENMSIGGSYISNPVAYVESDEEGWSVGTEIFNYFTVIFDFPRKKMYLKQKQENYNMEFWNKIGFSIVIEGGQVFIRNVWKGTEADKSGVEPGQRLLSINDFKLSALSSLVPCEIYTYLFAELSKDIVTVMVDGIEKPIELEREYLFSN